MNHFFKFWIFLIFLFLFSSLNCLAITRITNTSTIGSFGTGNGQFGFPAGIAFDSSGNFYVTDDDSDTVSNNRVQRFNSAGTFTGYIGNCASGTVCSSNITSSWCTDCAVNSTFGSDKNGGMEDPNAIAVATDGTIYVGDSNARIHIFNSDGVFQSWFGGCDNSSLDNCTANIGSSCTEATCGATAKTGSGNGQFDELVTGIAIDSSGNVFAVDDTNRRVQKFNY